MNSTDLIFNLIKEELDIQKEGEIEDHRYKQLVEARMKKNRGIETKKMSVEELRSFIKQILIE